MKRLLLFMIGLMAIQSISAQIVSSTSSIVHTQPKERTHYSYANIGVNVGGSGNDEINVGSGFAMIYGLSKPIKSSAFFFGAEAGFTSTSYKNDDDYSYSYTYTNSTTLDYNGKRRSLYVAPAKIGIRANFSEHVKMDTSIGLYLSLESDKVTVDSTYTDEAFKDKNGDIGFIAGVNFYLGKRFNFAITRRNGFRSIDPHICYTSFTAGVKFGPLLGAR